MGSAHKGDPFPTEDDLIASELDLFLPSIYFFEQYIFEKPFQINANYIGHLCATSILKIY